MKSAMVCGFFAFLLMTSSAWAQLPPIVDRAELMSDPEISYPLLSPDGQSMSFLKPYKGVRNVWIKKRSEPFDKARPLSAETRPVLAPRWSRDSKYVLYERDTGGDENCHIFQVDPKAKGMPTARDLTPMDKVKAQILSMPIKAPNEIVVVINDRDPKIPDVVRIDLTTGQRTLLWKNTQNFVEWLADLDGHLRLAMRRTGDGGSEVFKLDGGTPTSIYSVVGGESVRFHRFTADGNAFYFASNKGELDKMQLMLFDLKTDSVKVIDKDPKDETDIAETVFSDVTNDLIATVYVGDRRRVYFPPDRTSPWHLVPVRERRGAATTATGDLRYTSCVDRERLAQEIAHVFAARNEDAAAVYLFGSVARGEGRANSDLDVAVLYGKPADAGLAGLKLALAGDLEERLGRRVDLLVLDNQPPDLVHRVLRDGLIVLENNRSARIRFEVTARNEYFDVLPMLRRYRRPPEVHTA